MATVEAPVKTAQSGVKVTTGQSTTIVVRMASIELLIGGPYTKDGKEHTYGHAALRVITSDEEKVYDFGRYGGISGDFGAEGEGIFRVWNSFAAYIAVENLLGRMTHGFVHNVPEEKAKEVIAYYATLTATAKLRKASKNDAGLVRVNEYVLLQRYHALNSNCTTMMLNGAKIALPQIEQGSQQFNQGRGMSGAEKLAARAKGLGSWPSRIFMPADVRLMLEAGGAHKATQIKTYGSKP